MIQNKSIPIAILKALKMSMRLKWIYDYKLVLYDKQHFFVNQ